MSSSTTWALWLKICSKSSPAHTSPHMIAAVLFWQAPAPQLCLLNSLYGWPSRVPSSRLQRASLKQVYFSQSQTRHTVCKHSCWQKLSILGTPQLLHHHPLQEAVSALLGAFVRGCPSTFSGSLTALWRI